MNVDEQQKIDSVSRSEEKWLTTLEVIEEIGKALEEKKPLSIIRIGDGENICLTQYKVWPIKKTLSTRWGRLSRSTNWKGVRLPNIKLRDQLVDAIAKADIVGIPYYDDKEILARQRYLRPLTDECFEKYNLHPKQLCHTFVNRHMVEHHQFWEKLRGKKVVVISRWADDFKNLLISRYGAFDIKFVKTIQINRYEEIPKVMQKMKAIECDIVFISAGVNAVILAQLLADEQNRIAIDFGKSAIFMIKGDPKVKSWNPGKADHYRESAEGGEQT